MGAQEHGENPRNMDFAKAMGQLAKTAKVDARLLALFGQRIRPEIRPLKDAEQQLFSQLLARRRQLMDMRVAEQNRWFMAQGNVRGNIEQHLEWLKQHIDDVDKDLGAIRAGESRMESEGKFAFSLSKSPRWIVSMWM